MLRILMLALAVFGLASTARAETAPASDAPPPVPIPAPSVMEQRPDWLKKPTGQDFARYYPRRALFVGQDGHATLQCVVTEAGTLSVCSVVEEYPRGEGFGDAAQHMAPLFLMRPAIHDGVVVRGTVRIPIRFHSEGGGWIGWAMLGLLGLVTALSLALNDAMRGARGAPTVPVWAAYRSGLGFAARGWLAYPAPMLALASAGALDGWYDRGGGLASPWSLLVNVMTIWVTGAAYRHALAPLRPGDRALRLGPLGLQLGSTEGRVILGNILLFVLMLVPVVMVSVLGFTVVAVMRFALGLAPAYLNLAAAAVVLVAVAAILVIVLRGFLFTPHIVLVKAIELSAPWRGMRAALFAALAVTLLWLATIVGSAFLIALAGGVAVGLAPHPIAEASRWIAAGSEALVISMATPMFVGIQSFFYRRLLAPEAVRAAARPATVLD